MGTSLRGGGNEAVLRKKWLESLGGEAEAVSKCFAFAVETNRIDLTCNGEGSQSPGGRDSWKRRTLCHHSGPFAL